MYLRKAEGCSVIGAEANSIKSGPRVSDLCIEVISGSIIWGKGSTRLVEKVIVKPDGNHQYLYYVLKESFVWSREKARPILFEGNEMAFLTFLFEKEINEPYPYSNMQYAYPDTYDQFMSRSLEEVIIHGG